MRLARICRLARNAGRNALLLSLFGAAAARAGLVSPLDSTWAASTHIPIPHTIYAYVWPPSVVAGDTLSIYLASVSPTVTIRFKQVDVTDAYVLDSSGGPHAGVPAGPQLVSDDQGTNTGVWSTGCGWTPNLQVVVPSWWGSGAYLVEIWPENGEPSYNRQYAPFIVRDTAAAAPILVVPSTSTTYAYQGWGGKSTYDKTFWDRTHVAALDRPADTNDGRGQFAQFDLPWVRFLALARVTADYATMEDVHVQGRTLLDRYQEVIFTGHSEYWSDAQRAAVESYVAGGGNVFFASGNTCWWRIEYSPDMRRLVCYKGDNITDADGGTRGIPPGQQYLYGPLGPHPLHTSTYNWRYPPANRGAYSLTGLDWMDAIEGSVDADGHGTPGDWTVRDSTHWAFAGTGLANGARLGATHVSGDEVDGVLLEWMGPPDSATSVPVPKQDAYDHGTPYSFRIAATCEANPYYYSHPAFPLWAVMGGFQEAGQGMVFTLPYRHVGDDLWYDDGTKGNAVMRQVVLNVIGHLLTAGQPTVDVGRTPAPERLSARLYPNPLSLGVARAGSLKLALPRVSHVTFELFSAAGERVHHEEADLPAGEQRLAWSLPAPEPAGIYFWRLTAGRDSARGKLVLIR